MSLDLESKAMGYAQRIAYSSNETLQFTFRMAQKYHNYVPYSIFVECGVAAGAQVIAMLAGSNGHELWAFDSFQGIPLASNRDDQMPGIAMLTKAEQKALPDPGKQVLMSSGATVVSQMDFMNHVREALPYHAYQSLIIFDGWFEETLPKIDAEKIPPISILRLDGDLYNSTWVCLQHLFPKVIKGGVCIIDDWTLKGCQDACKEYFQLIGYEPDYQYLSGTAYFYK